MNAARHLEQLRSLPEQISTWPETHATVAAVEFVSEHEQPFLLNHSIRSYFYARSIGVTQGLIADEHYSDETLFLAAVLHDIGLTDEGAGPNRFEVDGANRAVRFVREHALSDDAVNLIWDAIALHTSPGIASHKRPEVALAHFGIGADIFGFGAEHVARPVLEAAHDAFPWLNLRDELIDIVAEQVEETPSKWAPMSFVEAAHRRVHPTSPFPTFDQLCAAPERPL